jgi:hypothetical protein
VALLGRSNLPPVAELAEPELRLGGYRINPRNNGPANSRLSWNNALSFQDIASKQIRDVPLPQGTRFVAPSWSPGRRQRRFPARRGERPGIVGREPGFRAGPPRHGTDGQRRLRHHAGMAARQQRGAGADDSRRPPRRAPPPPRRRRGRSSSQ